MPRSESELIEEVRSGFTDFNDGELDSVARRFHPDVELVPAGGQPPIRGVQAVRAWMEPDAFSSQIIEPAELTVSGNRVLVRIETRVRGSGSGIEMEFMMWGVWISDDDGSWIRIEVFLPHEEALAREAAGLSN